MSRVLVIYGSPRRRGNTALLLRQAVKGAREQGAEVEELMLRNLKRSPCLATYECKQGGRCVIRDDYSRVQDLILHRRRGGDPQAPRVSKRGLGGGRGPSAGHRGGKVPILTRLEGIMIIDSARDPECRKELVRVRAGDPTFSQVPIRGQSPRRHEIPR
jgi:hypothetical protein